MNDVVIVEFNYLISKNDYRVRKKLTKNIYHSSFLM